MSVHSDLAIGQLNVANNGNELLAILDIIAQESEANTDVSGYQELSANELIQCEIDCPNS